VAQVTRSGSDKPLKEEVMSTNGSAPRGLMRQGDVLLVPVDPELVNGEAPANRRVRDRVDGRVVLAEGEVTGHAHAILDEHARLEQQNFGEYRRTWVNSGHWTGSRTVLIIEGSPATLVHEEHDPLTVPPGGYLVRRQREYVPGRESSGWRTAGWRRVVD
jgi:hypothetical protein